MFQKAKPEDLRRVRDFYWNLIDEMKSENEKIGWKKGIYPTDEYLQDSILNGELYLLTNESGLCACVILNTCNEGYRNKACSRDNTQGGIGRQKAVRLDILGTPCDSP